MKLYQKSKTGRTKWTEITTSSNKLIVEWGLMGGKSQKTSKPCIGKNKGKANATTGASQAIAEMESLITRKKEAGYTESIPKESSSILKTAIDFNNLPESFCPCKPVNKAPQKILTSDKTYAQRKHNGHCLILVRGTEDTFKVYSRRMEDKTDIAKNIPEINDQVKLLNKNTIVLAEFFFTAKNGVEIVRKLASVIRTEDTEKALSRYNEFKSEGSFSCKVFDILFDHGNFVGDSDYLVRYKLLKDRKFNVPEIIFDWKTAETQALLEKWEGFVLRAPGMSTITYTTNGKADRAGSYKYKFMQEGDFIVISADYGEGGKHAKMYAKFHIAQYDENGFIVSCGSVGPGRQSHEELVKLTSDLNNGVRTFPFIVEIEHAGQDEKTHALTHGQILRIRDDKDVKECILND